ncbi:MAG: redoxin domain-containing protein [Bacteroidota bacterium]
MSFLKSISLLALWVGLSCFPLLVQAQVPYFTFPDLDGKTFTHTQLDPNKSTMIMMFDPYCDHCETQAGWIAEAATKFQHVQFVFVTIETEKEPIKAFRDKYFGKTSLKEQVKFLQDPDFMFEEYFGYTDDSVNIYLFKAGKKQRKYFGKETEAETLLKFL